MFAGIILAILVISSTHRLYEKQFKRKDNHITCHEVVHAAGESTKSIFELSEDLSGKVCQWFTFASAQEVEMYQLLSLLNEVSSAGRTLMEENQKLDVSLENI